MLFQAAVIAASIHVAAGLLHPSAVVYKVPEVWRSVLRKGRRLGHGGNGLVFRVSTRCGDNSHVAIKREKGHGHREDKCANAFKEARLQQALALDGVAPYIFDTIPESEASCEPGTVVQMSMELAHSDLDELISELRSAERNYWPAVRDIQVIAASVAEMLVKAYGKLHESLGYLHGDIKPKNIFVFVRGHHGSLPLEKVVSACLAGHCRYAMADLGRACREPCNTVIGGGVEYWSPDIYKKVLKEPDFDENVLRAGTYSMATNRARDYYAFGQTIWEILSGESTWPTKDLLMNGTYRSPAPLNLTFADKIIDIAFQEFDVDRLIQWPRVKTLVAQWQKLLNLSTNNVVRQPSLPCVGDCIQQGCGKFMTSQQVCALDDSDVQPRFDCIDAFDSYDQHDPSLFEI
eukprot:TRINITY_DN20988_c0_g2_i1.p1 TRINITY_DN20988_c0_g2~~TRINITY_DN20988_c0_g2_i1.p1  ORF type:complete len:414 (-),score=46.50 TRINITY_DN20988_c0_g2_i1:173-1387(-)